MLTTGGTMLDWSSYAILVYCMKSIINCLISMGFEIMVLKFHGLSCSSMPFLCQGFGSFLLQLPLFSWVLIGCYVYCAYFMRICDCCGHLFPHPIICMIQGLVTYEVYISILCVVFLLFFVETECFIYFQAVPMYSSSRFTCVQTELEKIIEAY